MQHERLADDDEAHPRAGAGDVDRAGALEGEHVALGLLLGRLDAGGVVVEVVRADVGRERGVERRARRLGELEGARLHLGPILCFLLLFFVRVECSVFVAEAVVEKAGSN